MEREEPPDDVYPNGGGYRRIRGGGAGMLSHEQRRIIDNASEEQGNSDQSIEKIITINEDVFNRTLEEDEVVNNYEGDDIPTQ